MVKKLVKLNENELRNIIKEAVTGFLTDDNYSLDGIADWEHEHSPEGIRNEFYPEGKEGDMEFDWDRNSGRPTEKQKGFRKDAMERMADKRKRSKYFTPKEERIGKKIMDKWVKGDRSLDDIEDVDINFSELKESVSESVKRMVSEMRHDRYSIESIRTIENGGEREVLVTLNNGTEVHIVPCHESWEQFGGTTDELYTTVDVAEAYNNWLHGGEEPDETEVDSLIVSTQEPDFPNESKNRKKNIVKLTESQLKDVVLESVRALIGEGVYGYPDGIDTIVLLSENDGELYKAWESIAMTVAKLAAKGKELSVEKLANSSAMKSYQQLCFRKYAKEQETGFDPRVCPSVFRRYMAERMIDDIINNQFRIKEISKKPVKESVCENNTIDIKGMSFTECGYVTSDVIMYVVENIDDFDMEYTRALNKAFKNRTSVKYEDHHLYNSIEERVFEYLEDNGVEYDESYVYEDIDEVFN